MDGDQVALTTRKREPSSHLAEALHHHEDSDTGDSVAKEDRDGTGVGKGIANTKEQTRSNGATKSDELNVTRLEASLDVSKLLSSLNIAVNIGSLADVVALGLDDTLDAPVRGNLAAAPNILLLLVVVGRHDS